MWRAAGKIVVRCDKKRPGRGFIWIGTSSVGHIFVEWHSMEQVSRRRWLSRNTHDLCLCTENHT